MPSCVLPEAVADDPASRLFWRQTLSLAALLHDVGHGPWSHTFEFLDLPTDFSAVTSKIDFLRERQF